VILTIVCVDSSRSCYEAPNEKVLLVSTYVYLDYVHFEAQRSIVRYVSFTFGRTAANR
jgi:hypothetical protein